MRAISLHCARRSRQSAARRPPRPQARPRRGATPRPERALVGRLPDPDPLADQHRVDALADGLDRAGAVLVGGLPVRARGRRCSGTSSRSGSRRRRPRGRAPRRGRARGRDGRPVPGRRDRRGGVGDGSHRAPYPPAARAGSARPGRRRPWASRCGQPGELESRSTVSSTTSTSAGWGAVRGGHEALHLGRVELPAGGLADPGGEALGLGGGVDRGGGVRARRSRSGARSRGRTAAGGVGAAVVDGRDVAVVDVDQQEGDGGRPVGAPSAGAVRELPEETHGPRAGHRQVRVSGRRPRVRAICCAAGSSAFTSTGRGVPANSGRSDGLSL